MKALVRIANDGGPLFTYVIFLVLLVVIFFFVRSFLDREKPIKKSIELVKSFAWFALAWGFLGSNIGLITAFDRIQAAGDIAPSILAEGLKMALVGPLFGIVVFVIARVCIITMIVRAKSSEL